MALVYGVSFLRWIRIVNVPEPESESQTWILQSDLYTPYAKPWFGWEEAMTNGRRRVGPRTNAVETIT